MLSNQITKVILSLEKKKYRDKYNLFKVEGHKLVHELLQSSFEIKSVIATKIWLENNNSLDRSIQVYEVDEREMKIISNFQSLPKVIALVKYPTIDPNITNKGLSLVLNGIQDPGNMGTILRIADWFGINDVLCDNACVDAYNPKVIQASMGAIFRKTPKYINIIEYLKIEKEKNTPIYGTFLNGENIYNTELTTNAIIIMGNEGQGISNEISTLVSTKLTIPSFCTEETSESLNVGIATGIILSEFKRRTI